MYEDYLIRGTAADDYIRFFAGTTKNLVERARKIHNTSPVASAALGRLLTAGTMMGTMLKGEDDLLTIQIKGDGPIGGITVTADSSARVKGYVGNASVDLPINPAGKLDVGGAVGNGYLQVIRDTGLKEPYTGQVNLISGEIAEDLTKYFAISEQVPSAVALGVLVDKDLSIKQAGGFIIQLMPGAPEEVIATLEKKLPEVTAITSLLEEGMTPEEFIEYLTPGMNPTVLEKIKPEYYCNCSRERVSRAIAGIGKDELNDIISEGKDIEINCRFCDKKYVFTVKDMQDMLSVLNESDK